jgi:hypothetical protein
MYAQVGDRLIVEGDTARTGLIIGTPHADGSPPYVVKWQWDGHIAMVSPGQFARIVRAGPDTGDQPIWAAGASPASSEATQKGTRFMEIPQCPEVAGGLEPQREFRAGRCTSC